MIPAEVRPQERDRADRPDQLDPHKLADLGNLELVARGVVDGFLIGLHRSPHRGFSVEFAENRAYNPGDDPRFLDWKMYARSDRLYIKQFEEETNLRAYLVLDVSSSMAWTSEAGRFVSKLHYGRMLAASLTMLLARQGDAVGLLAFDDRVRLHLHPRGSRRHVSTVLSSLAALQDGGATDAGAAVKDVAVRLRRRGLVILISDLLVQADETLRALRYLRHRGHEVLMLHVMDPAELELPSAGEAVFFDPESGDELRTNSAALRKHYREAVSEAIRKWRLEALRMGADYHVVSTDTPLGTALGSYLEKRARLG